MGITATWVEYGTPAAETLTSAIETAKADDPLAPATVITPTPAAAVALRRHLARAMGGMVGVGFHSMDALAELIAARQIVAQGIQVGVEREMIIAAVRAELAENPGSLGSISHHRATWETIARAITEITALEEPQLRVMADTGGIPAEVARLYEAVQAKVQSGGRAPIIRAALDELAARPSAASDLGPVIVYLPAATDTLSIRLLAGLSRYGQVNLICGLTGDAAADQAVISLADRLGAEGPPTGRPSLPNATEVLSANDVDDEVRCVARRLLALAQQHDIPLHRMAIVHPSGDPYARTVADVLASADIPHSGPSTETLGHTVVGRVLTGVLNVARSNFSRDSVIDLWASGVVVDSEGKALRAMQLDRRTRRLGVTVGKKSWSTKIESRRAELIEKLAADDEGGDADDERIRRTRAARESELADLAVITEELDALAALIDARPNEWSLVAEWVAVVLDRLCRPVAERYGWDEHQLNADTALRTALGRLASLDSVDPEPDREIVDETIETTLERPSPRRSRSGSGILVTTVESPPAVPLDAVAVIGMTEGSIPRVSREDVLLGDGLRGRLGLPTSDEATDAQHRSLLSTLASTSGPAILSFPRGDQRSGRTQIPSRWLVDALDRTTGTRPRAEALSHGTAVDGVTAIPSFAASIEQVATDGSRLDALHSGERGLAALAAASHPHPLEADPIIAAGVEMMNARARTEFTRFDGNLHGDGVDVLADGKVLSPTSLETYAACPRKWFFANALELGDEDRPEEIDRLQPMDKGTLAHEILERFIDEHITNDTFPSFGDAWSDEQRARMVEIAEEEFAGFESRGLTGHPRWWQHDKFEMLAVLDRTLRDDVQQRTKSKATPTEVEFSFGRNGTPPLVITLDDGREIKLRGQADRVDRTADGGAVVYDYKYGSAKSYDGINKDDGDPMLAGKKLQLMVYGLAAEQLLDTPEASAYYWFLKPGHTGEMRGYSLTDEKRALFRRTLGVLVDGISAGAFPARSGEYNAFWGAHDNCGFCAFNDICPSDRHEEWHRSRADVSLVDLVRMAEEGTTALLEGRS